MSDPTGYKFPIQNSDGTFSKNVDVFVPDSVANSNGIGALFALGQNFYGVLGNGTVDTLYSSPIQIGSLTNWKQVSQGGYHTALIKYDGTLWTCGYNTHGALGNGTNTNYSSPVQVGSLTDWSQVSAGSGFGLNCTQTLAIKTNGTLWAWGNGTRGQLGNGARVNYNSPVQIGLLTNWKQVDTGWYITGAIKTDGTLWTWGNDAYGRLGNGVAGAAIAYSSPIQIGSLTNWKQVACGYYHMSAIKTDGTLWAWGRNESGQLGNGTNSSYSSPIQIGSLSNWSQLSTGATRVAAIKTDGTLWCWGDNLYGSLGNGNTISYSSPIQIGLLTNWKQSTCGTYHTSAVKTDGTWWTWGYNGDGQLGNGTIVNYSSPIQVGSWTNWSSVSAHGNGPSTLMAIASGSTATAVVQNPVVDMDDMFVRKDLWYNAGLWTCGYDGYGQLGVGNRINYSSPVQVGSLTNWRLVSVGGSNDMGAIKTDGTLWAWGRNFSGSLGNGTTVKYSSPIQIGSLANWKYISFSGVHSGAIKTDGTLWIWGHNNYGQLGNNTYFEHYSSPIQIGSLTNWKQVACGYSVTKAIKTDGTLWGWGRNESGQLGNGTTVNYSSPVQIGSLNNWKQVSASSNVTLATKTDGTLWAWGGNGSGNLGNGTTVSYSSPIQIGSLNNWKQVSVGNAALAIKTDGTLWTWGYNNSGDLGNGTTVSYSSPVQIGSLNNWKQVSALLLSSAVKTDGTLWTWGFNYFGGLGNGTTISYSSPVQVGLLNIWKHVSAGYQLAAIQAPDYQLPQYVAGPPSGLSI